MLPIFAEVQREKPFLIEKILLNSFFSTSISQNDYFKKYFIYLFSEREEENEKGGDEHGFVKETLSSCLLSLAS